MKKFIVVDHSLYNLQGHHYECSVSVAEAAARLGYQPIIIANRAFPKALHPNNIEVITAFDVDWFDQVISIQQVPTWLKYIQLAREFWQNQPGEKLRQFKEYHFLYWGISRPKLRLFLEKVEGSILRLWGWIKQDVQLLRSIPLSNTLWGITKIVWRLLWFILGIFAELINQIWQKLFEFKPSSFGETLSQTLKQIKVTSDDHVLIHTLGIAQLEELLYFLESCDRYRLPHYHILLRRPLEDNVVIETKGMDLKTCLNRFYESELWSKFVTFYTDTEDLVKQHNALSAIQFIQVPIPFRQEKLKESLEQKKSDKPINLLYLGDARREKGYQYLPDLVAALWQDYIQPGKIKLTIQSNFNMTGGEPGILESRLKLEQYPSSKVSLIKTPMTPDDYYQLLADADIVILPYDPQSYQIRTSGVLNESLAAGKPVVVPANSWLSKQVDSSRASIYEHPEEIVSAVLKILENIEQFSEAAYQYRLGWKNKNSPDFFLKCLMNKKEVSSLEKPINFEAQKTQLERKIPKILFIIEGDVLLEKSESGLLSWQHLNYLSQCGYQIYGLFFPKTKVYREEQFDYFVTEVKAIIKTLPLIQSWILQPNSSIPTVSGVNLSKYIQDLQENKTSLIRDLVEYGNFDIPPSLIQFLKVQKIDVIFLNSVINYNLVKKLKLEKTPLICEMTQFQSHYYALSNLRDVDQDEFKLECQLLQSSTVILAHNSQEGDKIRELIHDSLVFSLPGKMSLSPPLKQIIHQETNSINFNLSEQYSSQKYCEIMNNVFTFILDNDALHLDNLNGFI